MSSPDPQQPQSDVGETGVITKEDLTAAIDSAIMHLVTLRTLVDVSLRDTDTSKPVPAAPTSFGDDDDDDVDPATCAHETRDETFDGIVCVDCGTKLS
jgi:hypothetical protein